MDETNNKQTDYIIITMNDGIIYKANYFYTYIAGEFHACSEIIARVSNVDGVICDIKFNDIVEIEYRVKDMREYIERVQTICNESNNVESTEECDGQSDNTDFDWNDYDPNKFPAVSDTGMFG